MEITVFNHRLTILTKFYILQEFSVYERRHLLTLSEDEFRRLHYLTLVSIEKFNQLRVTTQLLYPYSYLLEDFKIIVLYKKNIESCYLFSLFK